MFLTEICWTVAYQQIPSWAELNFEEKTKIVRKNGGLGAEPT